MTYDHHPASDAMVNHIAALVHDARPDWELTLLRIILSAHRSQCAGADLAIAALRAAQNPNLLTPKAIGWRGAHWEGLATRPVEAESSARCGECGKPESRCYTERPGPDDHVFYAAHPLVKTR